jgi:hypothetical protein
MKGIRFGSFHSYRDFHLILKPKEMAAPAVKVRKIDIEGADSSLDYTDFFGEAKYENVTQKFDFSTTVPQSEFLSLYSQIKNALHGKKMRIILDDDPLFYYLGRVSVSPFTTDRNIGLVSIECDCEPYKMKLQPTIMSVTVNGTDNIVLTNSRKRAVPEVLIETDSSLNIVFRESNIWDLGSGSYTLPELELVEGENIVTVTGSGTITFTYQEGSL